jgi:3-oxoacyl-[acyl-carrier-protein] synthase II
MTTVVVTGLGSVSGLGNSVAALWPAVLRGERGFRPLQLFATANHRTTLAGEVRDLAPAGLARRWRHMGRAEQFAVAAAREACAAIPAAVLQSDRTGVFFGSSTGALFEGERYLAALLQGREAPLGPIAGHQNDGPGTAVARELAVRGPVLTYSTACTSANMALAMALDALRAGEVDVAIAGGADELCEITYAGFNSLRAMDPQPTRPFRSGRAGLSMGEGSGVLVLETAAHARRRGALPLATLLGSGRSCDAHHVSAPDPNGAGAAAAIRQALADGSITPEQVTFVNAHGTGTPHNDDAESKAMAAVFGERAPSVPLTSTKSMVGHLLGAAGGIEAVLTTLSIVHRLLPPTAGDEPIDAALGLDVVTGAPRPLPAVNFGLSTNLAFGGNNAVVLFGSAPA